MVHLLGYFTSRLWDSLTSYGLRAASVVTGRFREGHVPTKTKLEKAVEENAADLNDAQRELVLAQFADWKRNRTRIAQVEDTLRLSRSKDSPGSQKTAELVNERAQLIDINGRIAKRLFEQLSDRS